MARSERNCTWAYSEVLPSAEGQELSDDKLSKFVEYEEVKLTVTGDVHEGKWIVKISYEHDHNSVYTVH